MLCYQVNFANENIAFSYFSLKLDKMQIKTGGVVSLLDSGVIPLTVVVSFITEYS
jgi:hypothetical protein